MRDIAREVLAKREGLMGLAFMSSGTGHDEEVDRFGEDEQR